MFQTVFILPQVLLKSGLLQQSLLFFSRLLTVVAHYFMTKLNHLPTILWVSVNTTTAQGQTDTQMDTQTDLPHPLPDGIRAL